jgi:hypothetical protein
LVLGFCDFARCAICARGAQRGVYERSAQPVRETVRVDARRQFLTERNEFCLLRISHVRHLDFSDAAHPIVGQEAALSTQGRTRTDGQPDHLNNFDIVLDTFHHRFIAIREQHPYPQKDPDYISANLQIISIPEQDLRKDNAPWTVEAEITPTLTHSPETATPAYPAPPKATSPMPNP